MAPGYHNIYLAHHTFEIYLAHHTFLQAAPLLKKLKNLMRFDSTSQGQSQVMSWTDQKPLFLPRLAMILCTWHDKCLPNCLYQKWNKTNELVSSKVVGLFARRFFVSFSVLTNAPVCEKG